MYRVVYRHHGEWQEQYASCADEARRIIAGLLSQKDVDTIAVDAVEPEYSPGW